MKKLLKVVLASVLCFGLCGYGSDSRNGENCS